MSLTVWQMAEIGVVAIATLHHAIASYWEDRQTPAPGTIVKIGRQKIHWYQQGHGAHTIVIDSSLGGMDGYLLIDKMAAIGRVAIYDRPGYGWSPSSWQARTSKQIESELQELLQVIEIEPPYFLVGNSFGSYNMRLFAHNYPEQVASLILTDGLSEQQMLALPWRMGLLKLFFTVSFLFVSIGAMLGIVRVLGMLGLFERIKPQLKNCDPVRLQQVKRSFYRASHWLTMAREMLGLDASGRQLRATQKLSPLPVMNIKAGTFLHPPGPALLWHWLIGPANRTRDRMQTSLADISTDTQQFSSLDSSHFVWVDRPDIILAAVEQAIDRVQQLSDLDRTVLQLDIKS
jgi:pimeloyl-ACP methyl ester carboxylesterase